MCDGYEDCPHIDDELLCELIPTKCISLCICLNLAIVCQNVSVTSNMLAMLPYVSYDISLAQLINPVNLFTKPETKIINLPHNAVDRICFPNSKSNNLYSLNMSYNFITKIFKNCFANYTKFIAIDLSYNQIFYLQPLSFNNITTLININLRNNDLNSIPKYTFFNMKGINVLNLKNNPLHRIMNQIFVRLSINLIQTLKYQICCIASSKTVCTAQKPWHSTCFDKLSILSMKVVFILMSACVILTNLVCLIWNILVIQKHYSLNRIQRVHDRSAGPYNIIICFINVGDLFYGIYLIITWASDTYYGASFMLDEDEWKRSTLCGFASMLVLFCSINQPLLFLFLAFSRLMVVQNPFDSKFKSTNYVLKCLISFTVIILSIDVAITAVVGHFKTIQTGMCMLFTDRSNAAAVFKVLTIVITIIHLHPFP